MRTTPRNYQVSIVLPNWNGAQLLAKNLPSVIAAAEGAEIVVADDASSDESVVLLKQKFPQIKVVENKMRQGFAGNVNSGVTRATGDIVILLNTDVRPQKGFLNPLLAHFANPEVFTVGCLEESHEKKGIVKRGRGEARWERGYFIHQRGEVDKPDTAWVAGGSGAFRKSIWDELGGMDALYNPFYWEDIDLSYRARKAGWKLVFEPKSVVGHFHEEGKIKTEFTPSDIKQIAYRNQFFFIWKNLSDPRLIIEHAFWTPIKIAKSLLGGDTLMLRGYLQAMFHLPRVLISRQRAAKLWRKRDRELIPQ